MSQAPLFEKLLKLPVIGSRPLDAMLTLTAGACLPIGQLAALSSHADPAGFALNMSRGIDTNAFAASVGTRSTMRW